ncbi:FAD-dependent oxidoreductase [Nonomuraea ferruginea]
MDRPAHVGDPGGVRPRARTAVPRGPAGPAHRLLRHQGAPRHLLPGAGQRCALDPHARTRWPGLYLAGAWTDTGWPDTMEGAVRSGLHAAGLVRRQLVTTPGRRS